LSANVELSVLGVFEVVERSIVTLGSVLEKAAPEKASGRNRMAVISDGPVSAEKSAEVYTC